MVLNSAKNRFDYDEEDKINELGNNTQFPDDMKSLDSFNSFGNVKPLSSAETGVSSIRNSKESSNSQNIQSFLGDKKKPACENSNINEDDNELDLQIKDSLKKLSQQYYYLNENENKSSYLFNYYCSPFLDNNYKKGDYYLNSGQNLENSSKICPFEFYKDI